MAVIKDSAAIVAVMAKKASNGVITAEAARETAKIEAAGTVVITAKTAARDTATANGITAGTEIRAREITAST